MKVTQILVSRTAPVGTVNKAIEWIANKYPEAKLHLLVQDNMLSEFKPESIKDRIIVPQGIFHLKEASHDLLDKISKLSPQIFLIPSNHPEFSGYAEWVRLGMSSKACKIVLINEKLKWKSVGKGYLLKEEWPSLLSKGKEMGRMILYILRWKIKSFFGKLPPLRCVKPFTNMEIYADGNCSFCCHMRVRIGNVFEKDIGAIFNSLKAKYYRAKILNGDYSDCKTHVCGIAGKNASLKEIDQSDPLFREDINHSLKNQKLTVPGGPAHLVDSVHNQCNVKCRFCWPFDRRGDAEREDYFFRFMTHENPNLKILNFAGGEPFFHPRFEEKLKFCIENQIACKFWSNMNLISDSVKILLEQVKIISWNASINAASEATYSKLIIGGKWERVCKNMEYLVQLKKKKNFAISMTMVVTNLNYQEIQDFIRMGLEQYHVESIGLHPLAIHDASRLLALNKDQASAVMAMMNDPFFLLHKEKITYRGLKNQIKEILDRSEI